MASEALADAERQPLIAHLPNLPWLSAERTLTAGLAALALAVIVPVPLLGVNYSYLTMICAALAGGATIAWAEGRGGRRLSFNLLVWALVIRSAVLTALFALSVREGGPFLGPDSTDYFYSSLELARAGFRLPEPAVVYYGTYDVGQFYLFAAMIRYLHADLFGLQLMNCALTALAAPLVLHVARAVVPRGAIWIAIIAAVHPTLVGLSAVDLLKDPSIICATVALLWALVQLTHADRRLPVACFSVVMLAAALYLRTSRFYVFAYIEGAFAVTLIVLATLRIRPFRRRAALVLSVFLFAAAEVIPIPLNWPASPVMVVRSAVYTMATPDMFFYKAGLMNRLSRRYRHLPERETGEGGLLAFSANVFRRTFGPFPWILPTDWHVRALQTGEYYLFPGMLLWYALLPAVLAGVLVSARRIGLREERRFGVLVLWFFMAVYFAQYLAINLSYRQRESMLPFLLVFGWIGLEWAISRRAWIHWYVGYWIVLCLIAGLHVGMRAVVDA